MYEPFAQSEIARLVELRAEAVEARLDAELALGRSAELVGELVTLIAEHPFRERLRGQLMLALYRSGRQADALAAFRAAREALVEELAVEPGPELRALEAAILRQDDSLAPAAPVVPSRSRRRTQRKPVTILRADVLDRGVLGGGSADPEIRGAATRRYVELASAVVAAYGGKPERSSGDLITAAFGDPHRARGRRAARGTRRGAVRDRVAALRAGPGPGRRGDGRRRAARAAGARPRSASP